MAIVHVFESAGLGVAPFKLSRIEMKRFSIPGVQGSTKPGASCEYCGHPIVECCIIRDANGKEFHVGNECVRKTGDAGLYDTVQRALKNARRDAKTALMAQIFCESRDILKSNFVSNYLKTQPHPNEYFASIGKTMLDYRLWQITNSTDSTKKALLTELRELSLNSSKKED